VVQVSLVVTDTQEVTVSVMAVPRRVMTPSQCATPVVVAVLVEQVLLVQVETVRQQVVQFRTVVLVVVVRSRGQR
jgi:hypothetical protein